MSDNNNFNVNEYSHVAIEEYWQKHWQNFSLISGHKEKKYILEMFPYPSGKIHMGHVRNYVLGDVLVRYNIKQGYDVLHAIPWDAFGLPAENAAQKNNLHPALWTYNNIANMRKSLQSIGLLCDWNLEFATCDLSYYKHQQKIFLDLYHAGFVYKQDLWVNWDPVDQTVLANEQVINGKGWRSEALVEKKKLSQWVFKITEFAADLLKGLDDLDWPEEVKQMQRNWIGQSHGFIITFKIRNTNLDFSEIQVYSTRPETIFGANCILLSLEHPITECLVRNNLALVYFIDYCQKTNDPLIKKGAFTDIEVIHPFTGKCLPVYIANFVLSNHGTGAIFSCPAHDQRDLDFAIKYKLPVIPVIQSEDEIVDQAYTGNGIMINSDFLNGLTTDEAKERIKKFDFIKEFTNYRLHDWCISRQRYWGCPIPIIYCAKCGILPAELPVVLPENIDIFCKGNPLNYHQEWKNITCHKCNSNAVRDTDTMDTFVDSAWYFARICSAKNSHVPFDDSDVNNWMPIDYYIGGIEHAILHLLYARFMCRALRKCGYSIPKEPFKNLFTQGMVCHKTYKNKETNEWVYPNDTYINNTGITCINNTNIEVIIGNIEAMSKSKCNIVVPDAIIDQYGADTARWFILSDTPPEKNIEWTSEGVEVSWRFIKKLWKLINKSMDKINDKDNLGLEHYITSDDGKALIKLMHQTIHIVTENIERLSYNCAIARIYEYYNAINSFIIKTNNDILILKEALINLIHLISPIIPHIAEEMWVKIGQEGMVSFAPWPKALPSYLQNDNVSIVIQVNGKFRDSIEVFKNISSEEILSIAKQSIKVSNAISSSNISKIIYVQDKILNIVTN